MNWIKNFKDDAPLVCESCGEIIYPGSKYYRYNDNPYCKLSHLPYEDCEATEEYIMKAEDYFLRYLE